MEISPPHLTEIGLQASAGYEEVGRNVERFFGEGYEGCHRAEEPYGIQTWTVTEHVVIPSKIIGHDADIVQQRVVAKGS